MARGTFLTDMEKGKITAFREEGLSFREIARKIKRSDKVVRNFIKNPSDYGQKKANAGRKSKLSARDKRKIVNCASNSTKTGNQIAHECGLNVSRWTVNRVLRQSTVIQRQKLKNAPRLLPRHRASRLIFAKNNMNTDWNKVSQTLTTES